MRANVIYANGVLRRRLGADPSIPAGFAPFGIQAANGMIFVTYAEQDANAEDEIDGAHLGYVDAFATNGTLIANVASAGPLNAPWGVAWAPDNFGRFGGARHGLSHPRHVWHQSVSEKLPVALQARSVPAALRMG